MSSWEAIEDRSYLDSIAVTVIDAVHHDDEKLDWRLTVEDTSGNQFDLEIWQKHDPLTDWEEGAKYEIRNAYGQTWSSGRKKKLHSSRKWSANRAESSYNCRLMVMGDSHVGRKEHPSKPHKSIDCAEKFKQAVEAAIVHKADCILHTGDVFHDYATEEDCSTVDATFQQIENTDIEFYYILGNHECDRGNRLLQRWERQGVATHLDMDGSEIVDGVKVYGHDHRPGSKFSVEDMGVPSFYLTRYRYWCFTRRLRLSGPVRMLTWMRSTPSRSIASTTSYPATFTILSGQLGTTGSSCMLARRKISVKTVMRQTPRCGF